MVKEIITWKDKADWENSVCPAHAEGYGTAKGRLIKIIDDETGEEKIIPFDPETLKLSTKVIDWHYDYEQ